MFPKTLVLFIASLTARAEQLSWMKSGDMCAGVYATCTDAPSCTSTAYGPCLGDAATPSMYFLSHFVGLAFVDEANYLSCADPTSCEHMNLVHPSGDGYRDLNRNASAGGSATYGYTMAGQIFGDLETYGGYVGVASFFNTGSVDIKASTNDFFVASADSQVRVTRNDSDFGAPVGPYTMCITALDSAGDCTENATYVPGQYKFSIFGYTSGNNYADGVAADQGAQTHMGIRMNVKVEGAVVTSAMVNDNIALADAGNVDVVKLTLKNAANQTAAIDFPTLYNYGPTPADPTVMADVTGSGSVKIKIKIAPGADNSITLDYLFSLDHIVNANTYFVYDPTVTGAAAPVLATANANAAATATMAPTAATPFSASVRRAPSQASLFIASAVAGATLLL